MKLAKSTASIRSPLIVVGVLLLTVVVNLSRDIRSTSMQTKSFRGILFDATETNGTKKALFGASHDHDTHPHYLLPEETSHARNSTSASLASEIPGDFVGSSRTMLAYPQHTWQNKSSPVQDLGLRVYVYDTSAWPQELAGVKECRLKQLVQEASPSNDNRITDIGMVELFETFVGRTRDPEEADVFVVPYPHATHCLSNCRPGPYKPNCGGVPAELIERLLEQLTHFEGEDMDRHLFLFGAGHMLNPKLQMASLKVVHGGRVYKVDQHNKKHRKTMNPRQRDGSFIMPYMNTHPIMQPSVVRERPDWWWTRPRKYSFVYIFGAKNQRMKDNPRIHRFRFQKHIKTKFHLDSNPNATLGGLPFVLGSPTPQYPSSSEDASKGLSPEEMLGLYRESTFCPCFPGDTPIQKRFFDVILSGCLPVVLKFPRVSPSTPQNKSTEEHSWHPFANSLLENTIPFYHPIQHEDPRYGLKRIDYKSFVVEVDLPANRGNVEEALERLLIHEPEELKRRQLAMKEVAPLLTFGLGPSNAHVYEDAFSMTVRSLKKYVDTQLPARTMHEANTTAY